MTAFTWTGKANDGNFDNPLNWQPNGVPSAADSVTISPTTATTVTISGNSSADGAGMLTTNKNVTLAASNQSTFTLGSGGTGTFANGGVFALESQNQNTDLIIGSARESLTGSGSLVLSGDAANRIYGAAAGDTLVNVNNTIEGGGALGGGALTLVNDTAGKIIADSAAVALVINTGAAVVSNSGLMEALGSSSGGGLALQSVINNGTSGRIAAVSGSVDLQGADLQGGTLSSSGSGAITVQAGNSATLDGSAHAVTNTGLVAVDNQGTLTLLGSLVNDGTVSLQSLNQATALVIGSPTLTVSGGGTIGLSDNASNDILGAAASDVFDNADNLIEGAGQIGDGQLTLVNHGTIAATGNASGLYLSGDTLITNTALIEALGNAGLVAQNTTIDDVEGGTLSAVSSNLYLQTTTVRGGLLSSTAAAAITVQGGEAATLDGSVSAVTNAGTLAVNNQGTLTALGNLVDTGLIFLQSANQVTEFVVGSPTLTLSGGGTISLSDNPDNFMFGASGADVLDNVNTTIAGAGQLGDAQLTLVNAASGTIDANQAYALTLDTSGEMVTNAGLLEATDGGTLIVLDTDVANTGTIYADGGDVSLGGGTISGGKLLAAAGGEFVVTGDNSGTLDGSSSAVVVSGAVAVNNQATLTLLGTIEDFAGIGLQSANQFTDLVIGPSTGTAGTVTLTGGGIITLSDNDSNRIYGGEAGDALSIAGATIEGAGQLGAGQLTLIDSGTIDASGGNALVLDTGGTAAMNTGVMEATGIGGLVIQSVVFNNGGNVLAAGGDVYLDGGDIGGGTLNSSGGAVIIVQASQSGTLNGYAHAVNNLGVVDIFNQGTLNLLGSLVNQGTLALQSTNQDTDLVIADAKVTLSGGGTVSLSDNSANRIYGVLATDKLVNANTTIEGAGQLGAGQLTLANSGTIAATGDNALVIDLGSTGVNNATGMLIGEGPGGLAVQNGTYTNDGTIQADDGSSVVFSNGASLANQTGTVLVDGTYAAISAGLGATLTAVTSSTAPMTGDDADIVLSGAGSSITFNGNTVESTLNSIAAGGTLQILDGRSYTTTLGIGNSGELDLGGGVLTATSLTSKAGSVVSGFGTIASPFTDAGSVVAAGGVLDLDAASTVSGSVSGTGTLTIDHAKTVLEAGAALEVSSIAMINAAALVLDTPVSFGGTFAVAGRGSLSGTGRFTNTGLFEQTGTGTATAVSDPFSNAGTILVGAGSAISFQDGVTNSGDIIDDGSLKDAAALTGGALIVGPPGAVASIARGAGAGPSTLSTLTLDGGQLDTSGTTLTVTGDYVDTASGTGNAYKPFAGVSGTIDGRGTKLAVAGVDGTNIASVNGTLTIAIAPGGSASFVIRNTGASGSAALRGALETTVNGGHITGHALSGSGVTAQNFGPIGGGSESATYTIAYSSGPLSGEAIHLASDFANVAGLTIDIVEATAPASQPAGGRIWAASVALPEMLSAHHAPAFC